MNFFWYPVINTCVSSIESVPVTAMILIILVYVSSENSAVILSKLQAVCFISTFYAYKYRPNT
jgi:hypothetical protein